VVMDFKHLELFVEKVNWVILRENGRLPINEELYSKMTKASLYSVVTSSKGFKKATYKYCTHVMGLTRVHIS